MKVAFGIVAILVGVFFLSGIFRGLRPRLSTVTGHMQRAHHVGDVVNGALLVIMFGGTGVLLLADVRLWWILLPSCAVLMFLWSRLVGKAMVRQLENRLEGTESDPEL